MADPFPGAVGYSRLQSFALERGFPQTKYAGALALCQDMAKALLNQGADRGVVSGGDLPRLFEQGIRNIDGCSHKGVGIIP